MKRLACSLIMVLLLSLSVAAGGGSASAGVITVGPAARACHLYSTLVGGTPPGSTVSFSSTAQCIKYLLQGGTLYSVSTTTSYVDATVPTWQDTGVYLAPGAVASITATGIATWYLTGGGTSTPDGFGTCMDSPGLTCLAAGLSFASLVGQVGGGMPFEVGSGPTMASGPGELYLGFNDNYYPDNAGGFTATITTYTPIR